MSGSLAPWQTRGEQEEANPIPASAPPWGQLYDFIPAGVG